MFDATTLFESDIAEMADRIQKVCMLHGIPCFLSFCIRDDGKESKYKNYINGSVSNNIKLTDDQICRHVAVSNGFDTILRSKKDDMDDDEARDNRDFHTDPMPDEEELGIDIEE